MSIGDKNAARIGAIWSASSSIVAMITQLGRVMILTRFLEKSDFGVVAIVNVIIGLCTVFTDLGFASVLLYKKNMDNQEFSSLYWLQNIVFGVMYLLLLLICPLIANFYEEPQLLDVIPLSGLGIIFLAIGKQYETVLQINYRFRTLAIRNIVTNILSLIFATILAYMQMGVYSLVLSTLLQLFLLNLWNIASAYKNRPLSLTLSFKKVLPLAKIGMYQTYTRVLDYFSSKLDVIIIGKFLGTEALGIYDLAKSLVYRIIDFIRSVIAQVATPIITNNNDNDELVRGRFLQLTSFVATTCVPICFIFATFGKEILYIAYGSNYTNAAFVVSIFSLTTLISCITSGFDILGVAKGRTDLNFKNTLYRTIISTPFIIIASLFDINIVAVVQLLLSIPLSFLFWRIVVTKTYPLDPTLFFKQLLDISIAFVVISIIVGIVNFLLTDFAIMPEKIVFIFKICLYCILVLFVCLTVIKTRIINVYRLFFNR